MGFKIEKVTCFVATDENGDEGILSSSMDGVMMPLVCADPVRIKLMYPIALYICAAFNTTFRVLQFDRMTDVTEEMRKKYSGAN